MFNDTGTPYDLAWYRLEQAEQCLRTAKVVLEIGDYKAAANRSYYSIFHSMRAVLATKGLDAKKHSGIISIFRKEFIKTGFFDIKFSGAIGRAFDLRGQSDYDDFYMVSKSEVEEQLKDAEEFAAVVRHFLES